MRPPAAPDVMENRSGKVIIRPRGRIMGVGDVTEVARSEGLDAPSAPADENLIGTLAIGAGLVLFGQTFQYVIDVRPLYALTKAWPLLTLPFAFLGAARLSLPYRTLLLATVFWMLLVAPFMGMVMLDIDALAAAASTIKVWALLTGFALPAWLIWLQPSRTALRRIVLGLGATTLVAFLLLSLAPQRLYQQGIEDTKIFLWDQERGNHLYVPLFFGLLAMFHVARSWSVRRAAWKVAMVATGFVVLLLFYKVRLPIAAAAIAVLAGQILSRPLRRVRVAIAAIVMAATVTPGLIAITSGSLTASLGNSLTTRQQEATTAIRFLEAHPLGWLTGVGSATRIGSGGLGEIVGDRYFYLADLGWLGVIFEYGIIGTLLIAALLAVTLVTTWRASADGDPLTGMTFDYTVWFALATLTTPVVFAPGELMCCLGLAVYLGGTQSSRRSPRAAAQASAIPSGWAGAGTRGSGGSRSE